MTEYPHMYEVAENSPSGKIGYRCRSCKHYTNAPSKTKFSSCPSPSNPPPTEDEASACMKESLRKAGLLT